MSQLYLEELNHTPVKEHLLLCNFVDDCRRSKAKVLRVQQIKNYQDPQLQHSHDTLKRTVEHKNVHFTCESLIQDGIKEGNKYEVLDFISSGVSVDFNDLQGEGMALLHHACMYDDYIIANSLIKQGASINQQDDFGCTPLHICCMWGSLKCAQILLGKGAITDVVDVDGNLAVDLAPDNSHLKATVRKHMNQKSKTDDGQIKQVRNRIQKKMLNDVQKLLKDGLSIDVVSDQKVSLLHIAVTNGYLSVARLLLENSANVNAADDILWTPLHCAAKYGQVKMVKLLLAHFANPHALTTNHLLPRELARDPQIIKDLENAEETFLDLEEQKTPVKTKRFSASLLDETDDESTESTINIQTRTIYRTKSSEKDVKMEKEIFMQMKDELRKELFRRSRTLSYSSPVASPLRSGQRFFCDDVRPPPLPPRDHPVLIDHFTKSFKRIQPVSSLKRTCTNANLQLHSTIIIQRALRRHLAKIERTNDGVIKMESDASSCYEELVLQNAEDIARNNDHQRTICRHHQRNSWGAGRTNTKLLGNHRPLSTGAVPEPPNTNQPNWLPNSTKSLQRPLDLPTGGQHNDYRSLNNGDYMQARVYGSYRRGDSVCSTDSGVSMMTMDYSGNNLMVAANNGLYGGNIELVGTIRRCLQSNSDANQDTSTDRHLIPPNDPTCYVTRQPTPSSSNGLHHHYTMRPLLHKNPPPVFIPPLTKTVAKIMSTATGLEPSPPPQVAPERNPHHFTIPRHQMMLRHQRPIMHRYGSLLHDRGSVLRESSRIQALNEQMEDARISNQPPVLRHSWDLDDHMTSPHKRHQPMTSQPLANQRSKSLSRRTGAPAPPPPPRNPQTRLSNPNELAVRARKTSNAPSEDDLPVVPPPLTLHHHSNGLRHQSDEEAALSLPPPPDHFLSHDGPFPPPPLDI